MGFALQTALIDDCSVEPLSALYSGPEIQKAKGIHDRLIESNRHCDREVAIWLEPILDLGPLKADPKTLESDIRKMELLLFFLINRAGSASREVNDWMNYIANAAESLAGGFWIDAKILLSQALEISRSESIENLRSSPALMREITVLQSATDSYFREIRTYPLKLSIPEARLQSILRIQGMMLNLMQIRDRKKSEEDDEIIMNSARRLGRVIRLLMDPGKKADIVEQELKMVSADIDCREKDIAREEKRRRVNECNSEMKEFLRKRLLDQLCEEPKEL